MKTVTIVINQDASFASTNLICKDQYGLTAARRLVQDKHFGNYSKNRFFIEIPIRNLDGEELVAYVSLRHIEMWKYVAFIESALSQLSTTWMIGESAGYMLLGGYMCRSVSPDWLLELPFDASKDVIDIGEQRIAAQARICIRPKFALPIHLSPKQ